MNTPAEEFAAALSGNLFSVVHASDRKKNPDKILVRCLTFDEVLALQSGQRVPFIRNDGRLSEVKINGKVRTWKRDKDRIEVPVKYGMYECGTLDKFEATTRFVKLIGE